MTNNKFPISNLDSRISKIIGQSQGIRKMINDKKSCLEIVQQIAAARAALAKLGGLVLVSSCKTGSDKNLEKKIQELTKLL